MTQTAITADQLTVGTIIRFKQSLFARGSITARIEPNSLWDGDADVRTTEQGNTYVIVFAYRVRPADLDVSFGQRKVYCINIENIEIVREAKA